MARVFLHHTVADYDAWRPIFDGDAPRREAAGMTDVVVLRDADDPSSIWLAGRGEPEKVTAMLQDPELGKAMQEAGVTSAPEVFFAS